MFLSKRGVLYAEVKMHNLDTGDFRTVNHREECWDDIEKLAYDEAVSQGKVIAMGVKIAEPIA